MNIIFNNFLLNDVYCFLIIQTISIGVIVPILACLSTRYYWRINIFATYLCTYSIKATITTQTSVIAVRIIVQRVFGWDYQRTFLRLMEIKNELIRGSVWNLETVSIQKVLTSWENSKNEFSFWSFLMDLHYWAMMRSFHK